MRSVHLSLFVMLFCLTTHLEAQQEPFTVLYTNAPHGVVYMYNGSEKRVFPGRQLHPDGYLLLEEGVFVNVLYDGVKEKLEGAKKYSLASVANSIQERGRTTFFSRFYQFLRNSIRQTNDPDQLERYHQQYMSEVTAGISGYGVREYAIQVPRYCAGPFADPVITLRWLPIDSIPTYIVRITDRNGTTTFLEAQTQAAALTVHLDQLALEQGEIYSWQVVAGQQEEVKLESPPLLFSYVPQEVAELRKAIRQSAQTDGYDPFEQDLYEVQLLEQEGFLYPAYQRYQELSAQEPDNTLYRQLFAAFLVRMDNLPEAQLQMNTP